LRLGDRLCLQMDIDYTERRERRGETEKQIRQYSMCGNPGTSRQNKPVTLTYSPVGRSCLDLADRGCLGATGDKGPKIRNPSRLGDNL